jgi:hypothetical protein
MASPRSTERLVMVSRTCEVVDYDQKILLPREYLDIKHPPTLQRGMPVILHRQALRPEEECNVDFDEDDEGSDVRGY